jgi:hypothetical protein
LEALRPLAALSYNRWVLATSVAIVILAAIGLEHLRTTAVEFRRWFLIPMLATAGFGCWCLYHRLTLKDLKDEQLFALCSDIGAGLSLIALVAWATTIRPVPYGEWIRLAIVALLPLELLCFAWNERRQDDMALYYPRIPVLEKLATLPMGRVWGVNCFPPNLNRTHGLEDVRGYDAVDPGDFIRLFNLTMDQQESIAPSYAWTQFALPLARQTGGSLNLHPVANLLNLRYLIFRAPPPRELNVILEGDGYWIAENSDALPRAYVPRSVRVVKDDRQALSEMKGFDFDPRQTTFMMEDLQLPKSIRGQASVRYETPTHAEIDVDMQTAGLIVLADLWDAGWRAELDGRPCPTYRVDVALRGFEAPPGKHRFVCTYDPQSVRRGFQAAAAGGVVLLLWTLWKSFAIRRRRAISHRG